MTLFDEKFLGIEIIIKLYLPFVSHELVQHFAFHRGGTTRPKGLFDFLAPFRHRLLWMKH
jgi:hypothetical protein